MNKKHVTLIVIIVLLSIVLVISGTYAFFLANVSGNEDAELIKITAGDFELTFTDSSGIYFDNDIRPGTSASKTFTVQNTGTADDKYTYTYNIKLTQLSVTYEKTDLAYTLQEYTNDQYTELKPDGVNETGYINSNTVNEDGEMYLAINIERPPKGTLHYYKLTIEFKKIDNVNQNYNQGKVFGGKINVDDNRDAELYEPKTFSKVIKVDNVNIFADDFENIRYAGASAEVHNYIWFNCNDYEGLNKDNAESKGCEKWRIIGLFKNVPKPESDSEDLVKIIRADSVGNIAWNSARTNNWMNASLRGNLESYYEGDKLSNADGITNATQGMIERVTWNLGGWYTQSITAQQIYEKERGNTVPSGAPKTYNGYIGLMYLSDYGYATTGSNNGNKSRATCLATKLWNYSGSNGCYEKDWLYITSTTQWTFTSCSSYSSDVFYVYNTGSIDFDYANSTYAVRPSLYLKSDVKVVGGQGTDSEPYILQQGE